MEKESLIANTRTLTTVHKFANYIGSLTTAKISGVFLERQDGGLQSVLRNMNDKPVLQDAGFVSTEPARACCGKCHKKNEEMLKHCGSQQNIKQRTTANAASIIQQSRFSDMLILDAEMSFDEHQNGIMSDITKTVLTKTECPVIIAPYAFSAIEEIFVAYDGSASAVFAIKQFTYLFPGMADKRITLIQVNNPGIADITNRNDMLGLLEKHYAVVAFHTLNGTASESLFEYLAGKRNAIVVMGAFGSNPLSNTYRPSTAEPLVKTINLPLFIAHQF